MESFWELIVDTLKTLGKALVVLFAIRVILLLVGIRFEVPVLDEWIQWIFDGLKRNVPQMRM